MSMIFDTNRLSFEDDNAPISLLDQCFRFIVQQLCTICFLDTSTDLYELHSGLVLPRELCEKVFQFYNQNAGASGIDDKFVNIFKNTSVTSIKRVRLRNSVISDQGLKILLQHKLIELDLEKCKTISARSLATLNEFGENLLHLTIGTDVSLLPSSLKSPPFDQEFLIYKGQAISPVIKAPKLRKLAIRNFKFVSNDQLYFDSLFKFLPQLVHLDLSGSTGIECLSFLTHLKRLVYLVLHNVVKVQDGLTSICELKSLRHLDISQSSDKVRTFQNENETLAQIVESLPNLISLDISGTNLAGTGIAEKNFNCDIPGLHSRVKTPLEFLGLYGTQFGACRRHDIPAKKISGDANEAQILTAAQAYIDRPEVLQRVLNDLYHLFRYAHCQNIHQALSVILEAMDRHLTEKHIQISGSATLFYIVKDKEIPPFPAKVKRQAITTLLNGMKAHDEEDTMMRNGCLILCQFKIPQDVLFEYERLVLMLLHIVADMEQEGFVQRIGIYLLNSLACQVDNYQKQLLGDLTAIEIMLKLIEDRLNRKVCDDVLEVAWSTMWNVTDETPINCKRFLDGNGLIYFLKCLTLFPTKEELMRNMMGLLGNVAEVRNLRNRLMNSVYIDLFVTLVSTQNDNIEVSYNAAGVLSHLASDGPDAWRPWNHMENPMSQLPPREQVLQKMVMAIQSWDLNSDRSINYRSFEPILQLACVRHTPACQLWAVWALANLTTVYPSKYCSLVEAEGGLVILRDILSEDSPIETTKTLARTVFDNCDKFKSSPQAAFLELDG